MGENRASTFSILIQILSGLVIAFFTSLLVYFKQKELLHDGVVLLLVSALYYSLRKVKTRVKFSDHDKIIAFIFLACIAIAGPQIIYQVRPYTFYISGIIICVITILILSSFVLDEQINQHFMEIQHLYNSVYNWILYPLDIYPIPDSQCLIHYYRIFCD